jgi:hypothetical protein
MSAKKNYKVEMRGHDTYAVIEQPTTQVVTTRSRARDAKELANFLNGGNGFNGYTPPFFLSKWQLPSIAA